MTWLPPPLGPSFLSPTQPTPTPPRTNTKGIAACDPELLLAIVPYLQAHVKLGGELRLVHEAGKELAADKGADLEVWMTYRGESGGLLVVQG